ncbi:hypothetical protein GGR54DRAFT_588720 [Hypoxylon sp. NC1633]|nr:hypothetical protein GGR54DRAFT_588720 [Hypoxylon sp. NC1633]
MTSPGSSFMPIKGREPFPPATEKTPTSILSGGSRTSHHARGSKRSRVTVEEDGNIRSKRRFSRPATPSSSPFQTLRVTKSTTASNRISLPNIEGSSSGYAYHDAPQGQATAAQLPVPRTTMEQLTPYPTRRPYEHGNQPSHDAEQPIISADIAISKNVRLLSDANTGHELAVTAGAPERPAADNSIDLYPLDQGFMEEDMACLLDTVLENVQETHIPPSSVTQAWDHDSRSAVEYDPTLQYSSPLGSSEAPKGSPLIEVAGKLGDDRDDLLDDDVDWNAVYTMTSTTPKGQAIDCNQGTVLSSPRQEIADVNKHVQHDPDVEKDARPPKPFVRSPFPGKVCDRPVVPGLSSETMLRTCFRMGEMINQAVRCLSSRQDVIFELYARVTYSNRESLERKQHFQFIDLFKDQRPYPTGMLTNWRTGSRLDCHSSVFLDLRGENKMCRCMCRPIRDSENPIGFALVVLAIRETTWANIQWMKMVVCGGSHGGETATAKL